MRCRQFLVWDRPLIPLRLHQQFFLMIDVCRIQHQRWLFVPQTKAGVVGGFSVYGRVIPFLFRSDKKMQDLQTTDFHKAFMWKGETYNPPPFSPHKKSLYWEHIANSIQVDVSDEIECSVKYNLTQDVICTNWSHTSACLCNFWVLSSLLIVKLE